MVKFKDWTDYTRFMLEYCPCTCLNCKYGTNGDVNKKQFVCMRTLSPVRLNITRLCPEWINKDNETLKDYGDEFTICIRSDIADEMEKISGLWSFEEIKEFVENYEDG